MDVASYRLWEWPWQWVRDLVPEAFDTVLLPVGTMEAHGVIPLGTDTLVPLALAEALAPRLPAVVAPPIYYGLTSSFRRYPGSMTLPRRLFTAYVSHVLAELARMGFRRLVVLNGHGGQAAEVRQAARRVHEATACGVVVLEWWEHAPTPDFIERPGSHGGTAETAAIQAIRPEWVYRDLWREDLQAPIRPGLQVYPFPGPVMQVGDETLRFLSEAEARAYWDGVVAAVEAILRRVFRQWSDLRLGC
jgi:creatinine amidohydrolase